MECGGGACERVSVGLSARGVDAGVQACRRAGGGCGCNVYQGAVPSPSPDIAPLGKPNKIKENQRVPKARRCAVVVAVPRVAP